MAVDSLGPKGQPQFDGTKAGSTAADLNAIADYAAGLVGGDVWGPQLGGNAASLGANAGYDGLWTNLGPKHVRLTGRLVFGSSASFGTGTPTLLGLPFALDPDHTTGYGHYRRLDSSGNPQRYDIALASTKANDNGFHILTPVAAGNGPTELKPAWVLGAPQQSSWLVFTIDGVRA